MTLYAEGTNVTLGATPISIPINATLKALIFVSLANNVAPGGTPANIVNVNPNGTAPALTIQYGSSQSYEMPTGTTWVQISGNGCNITYIVSDAPETINPTTLSLSGSDAASYGETGASVPTTYGFIADLSNVTTDQVWTAALVTLQEFSAGGNSRTYDVRHVLTGGQNIGVATGPVPSTVGSSIRVSFAAETPSSSNPATLGNGDYTFPLGAPIRLLPGETLAVYGKTSGSGQTVNVAWDYEGAPL